MTAQTDTSRRDDLIAANLAAVETRSATGPGTWSPR
jgi:hypothetical protein